MGGKSKQSQRTKNNARPSSSGRSAELLHSAVQLDSGLVGASGKPLPALFPTLAGTNFEVGLTPEFSLCFKKLNKKDPITKTKALTELTELVGRSDVEEVATSLPSWAHSYKILSVDTDRKVREATQICHGTIVSSCGRRVAPHLRALLPRWLAAQHDDHAPAQARAQASLNKTFPESKLPEVIAFCKEEVMGQIEEVLLGNESISNKTETAEEREAALERSQSAALQTLAFLLPRLPSAHAAWLRGRLQPLLASSRFWKLGQAPNANMRTAWYHALGAIVTCMGPSMDVAMGRKCVRALLNAKETGPPVATLAAALLYVTSLEGWLEWLDKRELLSKRIFDFLEIGGWGDARRLGDVLLPLIARLPQDMTGRGFHEALFDAAFKGLEKKVVLNSKTERQAWITMIAEFLRLLSTRDEEFVVEVSTSVHRTWLENILTRSYVPSTHVHIVRHSTTNMASLIKYWIKQSKEEQKFDMLAINFWQNVGSTVLGQIDKLSIDRGEICKALDVHIVLLQTLKNPQEPKNQSIKFDGDAPNVIEQAKSVQLHDSSTLERYKHNLNDLVEKICAQYIEFAGKKEISEIILTRLITIFVEFDSRELYVALSRRVDSDSASGLYDKVLRKWLAGDTMRCKAAVEMTFLIMKHLTDYERSKVYGTFDQFPPFVVEWCMSVALSHPARSWPSTRQWARGPLVSCTVPAICARVLGHGDSKAPLLLCLQHDDSGEMLISTETVSKVVEQFCVAINDVTSPLLEQRVAVACDLCVTLVGPVARPLLRALCKCTILVPRGDPRLAAETWCEARSAWRDGLASLIDKDKQDFLQEASRLVHYQLFTDDGTLSESRVEVAADVCPTLAGGANLAAAADVTRALLAFPEYAVDDTAVPVKRTLVESHALRHDCVMSNMNCPLDDDEIMLQVTDCIELAKHSIVSFATESIFRGIYLRSLFRHIKEDVEDRNEEEAETAEVERKEPSEADTYFAVEIARLLHDFAIVTSLHEGYAFWEHYNIIDKCKKRLDSVVPDLLEELSDCVKHELVRTLRVRAAECGRYWAMARAHCERVMDVKAEELSLIEREEDGNLLETITGDGYFHNLQADTKHTDDTEAKLRCAYLVMVRSIAVAFPAGDVTGETFLRAALEGRHEASADLIVDTYYKHNEVMLYEMDISNSPWSAVVSNASVAEFLTLNVTSRGWGLPAHHWDFATITLSSLAASLRASSIGWGTPKMALLTSSVLRLFSAVQQFIKSVPSECEKRQPSAHVAALPNEWKDIFAPDITRSLLELVLRVFESSSKEISQSQSRVLSCLCASIAQINYDHLPSSRPETLALGSVVTTASNVLTTPVHHGYKYLAHKLLQVMAKPLVLDDAEKLSLWSTQGADEDDDEDEEPSRPRFVLESALPALHSLLDLVDASLAGVRIGEETCEMVPLSDSYSMALGCLLLTEAILSTVGLARGDLRQHYAETIRREKLAEPLLTMTLRLLPGGVAEYARDGSENLPAPVRYKDLFLEVPEFTVDEPATASRLSSLSCRALFLTVSMSAMGARGWSGAQAARTARFVTRTVRAYVSPVLIHDQLQLVSEKVKSLPEDPDVTIHRSQGEVVCGIALEERRVELRVRLASDHPLGIPTLTSQGARHAQYTNWLALYLAYQNGTLLNALRMWIEATTRRVELSPQCYICYCRLHPATGRLPSVPCHQCRNKFHSQCLRKWFNSSNRSNCPLCRATF